MNSLIEAPLANASLEDLRTFYEEVRNSMSASLQGEPTNTGKTVDDLVGRAEKFATEGRILNVVSRARATDR